MSKAKTYLLHYLRGELCWDPVPSLNHHQQGIVVFVT